MSQSKTKSLNLGAMREMSVGQETQTRGDALAQKGDIVLWQLPPTLGDPIEALIFQQFFTDPSPAVGSSTSDL